jgi:hypothetical protein
MTAADEQAYAFGNAVPAQLERLRTLEALFDPGTFANLEALGPATGWRCLEIGAGGGSVARRLCARAGPTGSVLATDLDPRFLEGLSGLAAADGGLGPPGLTAGLRPRPAPASRRPRAPAPAAGAAGSMPGSAPAP